MSFWALFCAALACAVALPRAVFAALFHALNDALIHGFFATPRGYPGSIKSIRPAMTRSTPKSQARRAS